MASRTIASMQFTLSIPSVASIDTRLSYVLYDEGTASPYMLVTLTDLSSGSLARYGISSVTAKNILWESVIQHNSGSASTMSGVTTVISDRSISVGGSFRISLKPSGEYCILATRETTPTTGWGDKYITSRPVDPSVPYGWHVNTNSVGLRFDHRRQS